MSSSGGDNNINAATASQNKNDKNRTDSSAISHDLPRPSRSLPEAAHDDVQKHVIGRNVPATPSPQCRDGPSSTSCQPSLIIADKSGRPLTKELDAMFHGFDSNFRGDSKPVTTSAEAESMHASLDEGEAKMDDTDFKVKAHMIQGNNAVTPTHRRNSSTSRQRSHHCHMERISEADFDDSRTNNNTIGVGERNDDAPSRGFVDLSRTARTNTNVFNTSGTIIGDSMVADSTNSNMSSMFSPSPRRRKGAPGEEGTDGGSVHIRISHSEGWRHLVGRSSRSVDGIGEHERATNIDNNADRVRREANYSNGSPLVASLDAGMARLRRWIRVQRSSFGGSSASGGGHVSGSTDGGEADVSNHSVASMSAMQLGDVDIFALSHTESGHAASAAYSTSSEPMNFNHGGHTYYRPFEVHVRSHDQLLGADDSAFCYGSDDETASGLSSTILRPLVPTEARIGDDNYEYGHSVQEQNRQRTQSEPDRARIIDIFYSMYESRAIDRKRAIQSTASADDETSDQPRNSRRRWHRGTPSRSSSVPTSPIIEEEIDATDQQDNDYGAGSSREQLILENDEEQHPESSSVLEVPGDNSEPSVPSLSGIDGGGDVHDTTAVQSDPNRLARIRWMRINRRFSFMINTVAVLFSLLLFFIVIAWVLFISTYVLSHNKKCDVPLKEYFWMASLQLLLDIFRKDIMRWMCRHETDSGRRVPPRVIMYNVAYLIYAMLVLRVGILSVFVYEQTCSSTAPELFYASAVFIMFSLVAWALIVLGYLIPFCFVALILTQNGYFPNGDLASSRGVMGGRRARIGTGRISDIVGEAFPNTGSNPAPPGCTDRLRVVLLNEFPEAYQKECCICMMEYKEGEVIVATPCDHVFHKRCCQEWLQLSRTCPVCRIDLPDAVGMTSPDQDNARRNNRTRDVSREEALNLVRFFRRHRDQAVDTGGDLAEQSESQLQDLDP